MPLPCLRLWPLLKKERKYIFLYVLISALIEQLFKVDIIYKGNQG